MAIDHRTIVSEKKKFPFFIDCNYSCLVCGGKVSSAEKLFNQDTITTISPNFTATINKVWNNNKNNNRKQGTNRLCTHSCTSFAANNIFSLLRRYLLIQTFTASKQCRLMEQCEALAFVIFIYKEQRDDMEKW